jgi:hypothetical protein
MMLKLVVLASMLASISAADAAIKASGANLQLTGDGTITVSNFCRWEPYELYLCWPGRRFATCDLRHFC